MARRESKHPVEHRGPGLLGGLRNNFIAGVIVIAPIGLTVWLIWTLVGWVDGVVWPFVPDSYQPNALLNHYLPRRDGELWSVNIRGVGVVFFLAFTLLVGWIAKGFFGRSLIRYGESLVDRMPVVRNIYSGVKQLAETVFTQQEKSFEKACLVEYPRRGIWAVGFISTQTRGEVPRHVGQPLTSVFVPTTPNPTSGFLLFFPSSEIVELDMSIEEAAKLVISAGLVTPEDFVQQTNDMPLEAAE